MNSIIPVLISYISSVFTFSKKNLKLRKYIAIASGISHRFGWVIDLEGVGKQW